MFNDAWFYQALHMTLVFLGWQRERDIDRIAELATMTSVSGVRVSRDGRHLVRFGGPGEVVGDRNAQRGGALGDLQRLRSARKLDPVRIQVDPLSI